MTKSAITVCHQFLSHQSLGLHMSSSSGKVKHLGCSSYLYRYNSQPLCCSHCQRNHFHYDLRFNSNMKEYLFITFLQRVDPVYFSLSVMTTVLIHETICPRSNNNISGELNRLSTMMMSHFILHLLTFMLKP